MDSKIVFNQVSQQNGTTFAQMLRKYDKNILNIAGIVDILKYAGKDTVGTLFFLDTLKEDLDAFEKFRFSPSSIPYFDDELVEAFIQKAKEIRAVEDNYPKSANVAQEILESYKEKRRNKLATQKGVMPQDIKDVEIFVPTKEEKEAHPDTSFIEYGNPSYAIFYLLTTLVSSEIEFLKKKGEGISERNLETKSVREELEASLSRFMGKYHYQDGKLFRFNVEKNGVYFMDEDVLKNHEVLHYDSKRYFQIDGLIVDIETNQVINLAGVDKIKEEALLNQIKDKKLTAIKTKGVCVLMADGKEIAFVKEGRSLSTFEILARKKGKQYAENLRSADSTLFEIPDLIDVVQYADNSIDSSLISYLKSLKPKTEEKTKSDLDPIAHLFMAGYVPCFSHELTEKYTKWVNELVPVQVDDEGNHLVAVPQEIAVMLAKKYRRDKKEKLARIKRCDIESISDLDCLIVTSEDEKNMIRPYYRSDEEICTLKDPTRHEIKYMINAVKRNVADIKRENFKKIRREDEYGTSVISIQVSRNGGDISIKNRYNHTLDRETGENPDNTFNSNPDLISEGLSSALRQELGVDFYTTIVEIPYWHVRFGRCLFHYEHEVYGVYFSKDHYLKDGQVKPLKDCLDIGGSYLSKDGDLLLFDQRRGSGLFNVLNNEANGKKLKFETKGDLSYVYVGDRLLAKLKGSDMIGLYLKETMSLPDGFMSKAPLLEEFEAPNLLHIGDDVFKEAPCLKKVDAPNCLFAGSDALKESNEVVINMPNVFKEGKNTHLKTNPMLGENILSLSKRCPVEFKDKKVTMQLKNGQYTIFADGNKVAELDDEGAVKGLYLHHTKKLGYIPFPSLETLVAPQVEEVENWAFSGHTYQLKRLELPNCYYMASVPNEYTDAKITHENCQINAPYVYNNERGFEKGCLLKLLNSELYFNDSDGIFFNKYLKEKKLTVEEEGDKKYLYADGIHFITYDKRYKIIESVSLPGVEEIDLRIFNDDVYQLTRLSLPDVKRIKPTESKLEKLTKYSLKELHIPKLEDLGNRGYVLLDDFDDVKIEVNQEALKADGVLFFKDVLFDSKRGVFISRSAKESGFVIALNENIKKAGEYVGGTPEMRIVEKEGITSIFINSEEMISFEKGEVTKLKLDYIRNLGRSAIRDFDKLQELSMKNLESMEDSNINFCQIEKLNLPRLVRIDNYCFNSLRCHEISLPRLRYAKSSCFSSNSKCSKISLPSLREIDLDGSFEVSYGEFYSKNLETDYFKNNNQIFFGELLIDLTKQQVQFPNKTNPYVNFSKMLEKELKGAKITIHEEDGERILCADGRPVIKEQDGKITGLYLEKADTLSLKVFLPNLKEIIAPNATKIERGSGNRFTSLERLVADNVIEIEDDCFSFDSYRLYQEGHLKEISLKKVQKIGNNCFVGLEDVESLTLNNLRSCGEKCFVDMPYLQKMQAVHLVSAGKGSFERTYSLVDLKTPLLQNRLELFKSHPKRKAVLKSMKEKGFLSHILHTGSLAK